jgi:SpoVK/Ycf46/Vps4 family AAA+-type ATPase
MSKQDQTHSSVVSTLLALMDGLDSRGQVIVIGATNRLDALDPALRRPGRFDREFYFPLPDALAREKILQVYTKEWKPALTDQDIKKLTEMSHGFSGADLKALCVETALASVRRCFPQIYTSSGKVNVCLDHLKIDWKDILSSFKSKNQFLW